MTLLEFERAVSATLVTDVRIAPDGRWVAFATEESSRAGEHDAGTIWLVAADGRSAPRRLTTSEARDAAPRWSPDGSRLAFISDRLQRGTAQLYVLDVHAGAGEARRVTDHPTGVGDPLWSPDGRWLAWIAPDAPEPDAERRTASRDDARVVDVDVRRSGLWLLEAPHDLAAPAVPIPEARRLSPPGLHVGSYVDSGVIGMPDSRALLVVTAAQPKPDAFARPDLVSIDLDGGVTPVAHVEGLTACPAVSPDGSTIAVIAADGAIPARWVLQTLPARGGERRVVMPGYRGTFDRVAWLPDGRLLAGITEGQRGRLAIVDGEARTVVDAVGKPALDAVDTSLGGAGFSVAADGRRVAFTLAHARSFGDVWVADIGGGARQLTDLNPWLREADLGEQREIRWRSFDGLEIEGLLVLPVGYQPGRRYPLFTHIHGGPADAWLHGPFVDGHNWGQFLAQRGIAVFMPNPRGSTGRGSEFLCSIIGCYGEPDFQDIMTGVDHLIAEGVADPERLAVGGWSGGGYLTNWAITHTDRFRAAISGAGPGNWISYMGTGDIRFVFGRYLGDPAEDPSVGWRLSPVRYANQASTPTLFLHGENDRRVPVTQGYEMYEALKARGVETRMVVYPREGHGIAERAHQADVLRRVVEWLGEGIGDRE